MLKTSANQKIEHLNLLNQRFFYKTSIYEAIY